MSLFLCIIIFAAAYTIKGGSLGYIPVLKAFQNSGWLQGRIMDGKVLSTILVSSYAALSCPVEGMHAFAVAVWTAGMWLLAVSPSMGEEAGAIGRMGHWWGPYKELGFTRSYGVKKGLQRGVWTGAVFAMVFGHAYIFIPILGIGFVAAHFIGQDLCWRITKTEGWAWAEPLYGALIGLSIALATGV